MFSTRANAFDLKQALEQATEKYDAHQLSTGNHGDLIASCAYNVIVDSKTGVVTALKIGAPDFVLEQFKALFANHSISYRIEGKNQEYLMVRYDEFKAKQLTSQDQKLFLETLDKTLNAGSWSRCLMM